MTIIRNRTPEALRERILLACELLLESAVDKKFADATDYSVFNLGVHSLNSMLVEGRHEEAIEQFVKLLRSNGDRHGS